MSSSISSSSLPLFRFQQRLLLSVMMLMTTVCLSEIIAQWPHDYHWRNIMATNTHLHLKKKQWSHEYHRKEDIIATTTLNINKTLSHEQFGHRPTEYPPGMYSKVEFKRLNSSEPCLQSSKLKVITANIFFTSNFDLHFTLDI